MFAAKADEPRRVKRTVAWAGKSIVSREQRELLEQQTRHAAQDQGAKRDIYRPLHRRVCGCARFIGGPYIAALNNVAAAVPRSIMD